MVGWLGVCWVCLGNMFCHEAAAVAVKAVAGRCMMRLVQRIHVAGCAKAVEEQQPFCGLSCSIGVRWWLGGGSSRRFADVDTPRPATHLPNVVCLHAHSVVCLHTHSAVCLHY